MRGRYLRVPRLKPLPRPQSASAASISSSPDAGTCGSTLSFSLDGFFALGVALRLEELS